MENIFELAASFNRVPVEANKVSGTSTLWRSRRNCSNGHVTDGQFADDHSWVVRNSFFADTARIRTDHSRTVHAERYGGFGIGVNGGGARVVNVAGAQIKGVGTNALAGQSAPRSHSYGGLDIQGAVKEVIYSQLLARISPVGVQGIDGLILLDRTSALHEGNSAPSVLMVREPVTRPAHFLPCISFRLKPEHRALVRPDYTRILGIYKGIGKQALLSELYASIQNFLDKCADQLSFFRMARLSHNALGPSNVGIDGRVLDTGLCSFVVSGSNYGQVTSYLEEPSVPVIVAREWFYLIEKFLADKPVEEHFLKLYQEKFYQYASVNLGFVFGLDREMSTKLSGSPEWRKVAARTLSLVSAGSQTKTSKLPTVDAVDFVNDILSASLYSILHDREVNKEHKFLHEFASDLRALTATMAPTLGWHGQGERSFCKSFAIQTVKRAVLSSYFFITYIGRMVDEHYAAGDIDGTAELIDENGRVAGWLYENLLSEHSTLYSGNGVSILYSSVTDDFIHRGADGAETRFADGHALRAVIDANMSGYIIRGYDFRPYLLSLLSLLEGDASRSFNGVKNVFR
jgi:hypothetical protein